MPKQYTVNEIFWSIQGEGMRAGEASLFIRFTGCNLRCSMEPGPKSPGGFDCDTEFASGRQMTAAEIVAEAIAQVGMDQAAREKCPPWVIFSGGEPSLQVDADLVDALHAAHFRCAIETNGTRDVSGMGLDWVTVSPKVAEHAVRQPTATELRYVRGYGQAVPKPACRAEYQFISPAFDGDAVDRRTLDWCINLVKENPAWRLSIQSHKLLRIR